MQQRSEKKGSEEAPFSDPFFVFIVLSGVLGEVFDPQVKPGESDATRDWKLHRFSTSPPHGFPDSALHPYAVRGFVVANLILMLESQANVVQAI